MVSQFGIYQYGIALAFRLVNAFVSTAFFQPDEYFQAWEVAYSDVYGVGFRSWEWEAGVRTSLIPRVFAALIRFAAYINVDHLVLGKIVMAFVAALGDLYTAALSEIIFPGTGRSAFMLSLFSMFNWYISTRPFSNTFEMVIVVVSLYYWVKSTNNAAKINWALLGLAILIAQFACSLRPNEVILWPILAIDVLYRTPSLLGRIMFLLYSLVIVVLTQAGVTKLDFDYYKLSEKNVYPLIEFVRYNFGSKISEIYGVQPWHWYFSQGIPFIMLGYLPFLITGWTRTPLKWRVLLFVNIVVFSIIPHKEFRFIYFLLPVMHTVAAIGLPKIPRWLRRTACLLNLVVGIYFSHFHQCGVVKAVELIREDHSIDEVSFLMPCHSTQWHAHFQRHDDPSFKPQFFTCNPPWNISSVGYVDQADQFYMNPSAYLKENPEYLSKYVVVFEPLVDLMESMNYSIKGSFFNGLFNDDRRRQGRVFILQENE